MKLNTNLRATSWKVCLEILVKCRPTPWLETPITFNDRKQGASKANSRVLIGYIRHLALLVAWRYRRLWKFGLVGGSGAILTFGLTWMLTESIGFHYLASLVFAVAVATVSNYTLNALWTFAPDKRPQDPDYDWHAFWAGNPIQRWWKRRIAEAVWSWVPAGANVLNIGCGSSPIMQQYPQGTAIDVDTGKLAFMRSRMRRATFHQMSALCLDFPGASFPYVICTEVLEHVEYTFMAASEIARVLQPGGLAVVAVPDTSKRLWHLAERFTPYKDGHCQQFTGLSLTALFGQFGLVRTGVKYVAGCDLVMAFRKPAAPHA